MAAQLKLISHKLCPYVQRAVIALTEKGVAVRADRYRSCQQAGLVSGDLAARQDAGAAGRRYARSFESAVILEYLEETQPKPLHPADPLTRAEHRAWIEFGSAVLNDIAGFYAAPDEAAFKAKASQLEAAFCAAGGARRGRAMVRRREFSLVDAVFGPVFRYFDVFDEIADFGILAGKPKLARWRKRLRRGRRCAPPSAPIIRRCCATSSSRIAVQS